MAATLVLATVVLSKWPRQDIMTPDSGGYINWWSARTAFYPLAIAAWRGITGSVESIIYLQFVAVVATFTLLCCELYSTTRSRVAATVLVVVTMSHGYLFDQVFAVIPEGFFLAFLLLSTALLVRYARTHSLRCLALLSLSVALAITARPAGYPLAAFAMIVLLIKHPAGQSRRRRLVALVLPAFLTLATAALVSYAVHRDAQPRSIARLNIFGKAAFLSPTGVQGRHPELVRFLDEKLAKARRADRGISDMTLRWLWRRGLYEHLIFIVARDALNETARKTGTPADFVGAEVAYDLIAAHPDEYLYDVLLNFYALWSAPELQLEATAARYNAFLEKHARESAPEKSPRAVVLPRPLWRFLVSKGARLAALVSTLAFSLIGIAALIRRKRVQPTVAACACVGLFINGYFLLVALVHVGLSRYGVMMWPLLWFVILCALVTIADRRWPPPTGCQPT